jgi:hypothetical protein
MLKGKDSIKTSLRKKTSVSYLLRCLVEVIGTISLRIGSLAAKSGVYQETYFSADIYRREIHTY